MRRQENDKKHDTQSRLGAQAPFGGGVKYAGGVVAEDRHVCFEACRLPKTADVSSLDL